MIVTSVAGNTLTVQRGKDGTSAASHSSGKTVGLLTGPPCTASMALRQQRTARTGPGPTTAAPRSAIILPRKFTSLATKPSSPLRIHNTSRSCGSTRGTTWSTTWVRRPATGGCASSARTTTPSCSTASDTLDLPGSGTFTINYNEILRWIAQGPNPFPQQLRAGRVKYYGSIPTAITGAWPNYGNTDQRFWVEFIDYVLGFRQTSAGVYQDVSDMDGLRQRVHLGNHPITSPPGSQTQYMSYTDNPRGPACATGSVPWPWSIICRITTWIPTSRIISTCSPAIATRHRSTRPSRPTWPPSPRCRLNHPNDWVTSFHIAGRGLRRIGQRRAVQLRRGAHWERTTTTRRPR